MSDTDRRSTERTAIALFAQLRVDDTETTCQATDVSAGGIRLAASDLDVEIGQPVEVEFELPFSDRTISTRGKVAHVSATEIGISFAKLPRSASKAIERFVDENGPLS